jgi:hypothetical protein
MSNYLINSLNNTLSSYNSSNYFHVGPRYQLLGFINSFVSFIKTTNSKNNILAPENVTKNVIDKFIKVGE